MGRDGARDAQEHGRRGGDAAVLITAAEPSYAEQYAIRRRKYVILMSARIPCLILAGVFGFAYEIWWLALAFVILSVPLPWMAVLIANDRGPRRAEHINRLGHGLEARDRGHRELESGNHPIIEG